jgi:hypothetical protein
VLFQITRSHALHGDSRSDALRREWFVRRVESGGGDLQEYDAERRPVRSHAERGNELPTGR